MRHLADPQIIRTTMKTTITTLAAALALALPALGQNASGTAAQGSGTNAAVSSQPRQTAPPPSPAATQAGIEAGTQQLFELLDTNKDGTLSRDEFMRMSSLSDTQRAGSPDATAPASTGTTNPQR
jgi:hypothetical protein